MKTITAQFDGFTDSYYYHLLTTKDDLKKGDYIYVTSPYEGDDFAIAVVDSYEEQLTKEPLEDNLWVKSKLKISKELTDNGRMSLYEFEFLKAGKDIFYRNIWTHGGLQSCLTKILNRNYNDFILVETGRPIEISEEDTSDKRKDFYHYKLTKSIIPNNGLYFEINDHLDNKVYINIDEITTITNKTLQITHDELYYLKMDIDQPKRTEVFKNIVNTINTYECLRSKDTSFEYDLIDAIKGYIRSTIPHNIYINYDLKLKEYVKDLDKYIFAYDKEENSNKTCGQLQEEFKIFSPIEVEGLNKVNSIHNTTIEKNYVDLFLIEDLQKEDLEELEDINSLLPMTRKLTYLGGLSCTSFLEIEEYNKEKELWRQIDCYCDEFEEMSS